MNHLSPETILGLARDFMESRILLSGAELDLFTLLAPAPMTAKEIASRRGVNLRALTIHLDALTAMGLLTKQDEKYHCPPEVASFLSKDSPRSVLPMVLHTAHLWPRWSPLTRIVQGIKPEEEPGGPFKKEEELKAFIGAMDVVAAPLALRIVAAVNPGPARFLLDVGGASGTYTIAFLNAVPGMKATLFDRTAVVAMARERLEQTGLLDRVSLVAGDFCRDDFPPGHDLAFVSAIIHQNSPEQNQDLYTKVFRALSPGGRIVIRDHVMESDRTRPRDGAIFAVNMLTGTSGGNTYTFEEIKSGLAKVGFVRIRLLQTGERMDALLEGFKPQ